jgi:iron complex outermembrane receptor protein
MKTKIMMKRTCLLACCSVWPSVAIAQTNPAPAAAQPEQSSGLEEIIVTAQKRSERLQDVPIAVTALTSSTLQSTHALSTQDLQISVPSLVYNSVAGFAQPYLRGIGSDITAPNADPSVATYIDGAFISNNQATITGLLGVDRIEVLEGPQGTLYGRNAVGGAINIYTVNPQQDTDIAFTGTYGNYDRFEGSGHMSGGITDNLSVGVYGAYTNRDTYLHVLQVGSKDGQPTREVNLGVRAKAVWTPSDTVKLTASVEQDNHISLEDQGFRNIQPNALGVAFGAPFDPRPYHIQASQPLFTRNRQTAVTLREEVNLGWANLLGISNFRYVHAVADDDIDATIVPIYGGGQLPNISRQYSQELQLISAPASRIKWLLGAFYFHEDTGFFPNDAQSAVLFPAPITGINTYGGVHVNSYAVFGQATAPLSFISNKFHLTIGGRYTIDHKSLYDVRQDFLVGDTVVQSIPYPNDHHQWKEFTPKVTLDYKVGGTLIYATFSKGFKAGAYNLPSPSFTPKPVNPEHLTAYEIGTKSDFLGGHIRFNTAAYYYNFKNIQVQVLDVAAGAATVLQNAASAEAYGLEATLAVRPFHDFTISANGAWEHSRYKKFPDFASFDRSTVPSTSIAVDVSGNQLQRAPKWVGSVAADYNHEFDNKSAIKANVNAYYNGGFAFDAARLVVQPKYEIVNASIGYTMPGGNYTISGWVTNLTNKYYSTSSLLTPFNTIVLDGPPRMYGVTVSLKLR